MPTVLLNGALSLAPDRSLAVRGPDRVAVVCPMYNEEAGAARALASLLAQTRPADELAVSINGGTDATGEVVRATLRAHGFAPEAPTRLAALPARVECWRAPERPLRVLVLEYRRQVAKSESVNNLLAAGLLDAERWLLVDGDTVFAPDFLEALQDHFYRLRRVRGPGPRRYVLDDVALQSGAVDSWRPADAGARQRFISRARAAEYTFSGVVRRGQARPVGEGAVFGRSRLFTVVGCGFAVRRDQLPVPSDTLTEDHDLTLRAQATPVSVETLDPRTLAERGFRVVVDGAERDPREVLDAGDTVEVRRGGEARFVGRARMQTEDPPHLSGYLRQIERWNGGGIQNALKRLLPLGFPDPQSPNTRFVVWSSLLENLLGLLLLLVLPVSLALHLGNPSIGVPWTALGAWFGLDLAVVLAMTGWGLYRDGRDRAVPRGRALRAALIGAMRSGPALFVLKYLNPVSYVAAASRVVPAYVSERRAARSGAFRSTRGIAWDRPTVRRYHARTAGAAASMLATVLLAFVGAFNLAPYLRPVNAEAWRLIHQGSREAMDEHASLPPLGLQLGVAADARPGPRVVLAVAEGAPSVGAALPSVAMPSAPAPARLPSDAAGSRRWEGDAERGAAPPAPSAAAVSPAGPVDLADPAAAPAIAIPSVAAPAVAAPAVAAGAVATSSAAAPSLATAATLRGAVGRLQTPAVAAALPDAPRPAPAPAATVSAYCSPTLVPHPAAATRRIEGPASDAAPLDRWELLVLARLAPIEPLVEAAATAYDLPVNAYLQVLLNESYLDPLAVGPTGDKGLSQMTDDALTLLRGISDDPASPFYNPFLLRGAYNVFDPDFSVCGGAAKLAWARSQRGAEGLEEAYALFINPIDGLRHGRVSPRHASAVAAMDALEPLVRRLGTAYARYRRDPASVSAEARTLLDISRDIADGRATVADGYRRSYALVQRLQLDDETLYRAVFTKLYPDALASAGDGSR